jgi:uncharacterized protein YodC (DUF2158 family)
MTWFTRIAGVALLAAGVVVPLAASPASAGLDLTGSISGTVRSTDTGRPIHRFCAIAMSGHHRAAVDCDPVDGQYDLTGLAAGTYEVGFTTRTSIDRAGRYAPRWYGGGSDRTTATGVTVLVALPTDGINASLHPGARLTGHVTDRADGKPLGGAAKVCVTARPLHPIAVPTTAARMSHLASFECSADFHRGRFAMGGLPSGRYLVDFDGATLDGPYFSQWYDGAATRHAARAVRARLGHAAHGIDAALKPAGTIAGRIVDAATDQPLTSHDVQVAVESVTTHHISTDQVISAHGGFAAGQLDAGTYRLRVVPVSSAYRGVWFDDATSFVGAMDIHVVTGKSTHIPVIRVAPTSR